MATRTYIPPVSNPFSTGVRLFDDLAETIRNPPPNRPLQGAVGRGGQKFCDAVGAVPGEIRNRLGGSFWTAALVCNPYWNSKGYTPPQPAGGFLGGQCNALYTVNLDVADFEFQRVVCSTGVVEFTGSPQNFGLANVQGPIQRIFPKVTATGNCGPITYVLAIIDRDGVERLGGTIATTTATRRIDILQFNPKVVRSNGSPDTCGDRPGGLEPGPNPPPTPTFPPGEEPGLDDDDRPFFTVPPIDSPIVGGEPTDVPEGGGEGGGIGPTQPPAAGQDESGENGDNPFPEPEEGRRWVGCCITLTTIPEGTGTVPSSAPELVLTEVVGNARLLFDSVSGQGYDTPIQIRFKDFCLWEPVKGLNPIGVRVNLKPGFAFSYKPYSVEETE